MNTNVILVILFGILILARTFGKGAQQVTGGLLVIIGAAVALGIVHTAFL